MSRVRRANVDGGNVSRFFQIKCRRVYQFVEAGAAHFVETDAGAMFVCPQSLDLAIKNEAAAPPIKIVRLIADAATENPLGEIEI